MQNTGDAFAIKETNNFEQSYIYIYRLLYQNFTVTANQKPYNRYTHE